jgi:hypothetical protein
MMNIHIIKGAKSCGKTSALGMVYALLMNSGATLVPGGGPTSIPGAAKRDFEVRLLWKGKEIAICTAGDSLSYIKGTIAKYTSTAYTLVIAQNTLAAPVFPAVSPPHIITTYTKTIAGLPRSTAIYTARLIDDMKFAQDIFAHLP